MATPASASAQLPDTPTSREIASKGNDLAALLAAAGNGIRITGLVLVVDEPREFKGTSKNGGQYAFKIRDCQIFTGNKAVQCKHQLDIGEEFPEMTAGEVRTFKIKSVRMNGTVPVFELDKSA